MEVKILSQRYNPLLRRKEVAFKVERERNVGTSPRFDVRKKLAEMLKTELELVYVKRLETKTGTVIDVGEANVYDAIEQAQLIEPKYVVDRNSTPEKSEKKE